MAITSGWLKNRPTRTQNPFILTRGYGVDRTINNPFASKSQFPPDQAANDVDWASVVPEFWPLVARE
jgi:hypothetical protein